VGVRDARAAIGIPSELFLVLFQGIIRPYKGISFLLKSWKKALQAGLHGKLLIVGTGDKEVLADIEREVASIGVGSSVTLVLRFVTVEQLENYYQASDILVYPYSAVTTSGALMTGIGFGKAIIATALPAFQEILCHEKNSLLVECGNEEGLSAALLRLAMDEDLRSRLARSLNATNNSLQSWKEIAEQTIQCYENVLQDTSAQNQTAESESIPISTTH
jgi:glycosyltransferase involved in cell wall biosynthesis